MAGVSDSQRQTFASAASPERLPAESTDEVSATSSTLESLSAPLGDESDDITRMRRRLALYQERDRTFAAAGGPMLWDADTQGRVSSAPALEAYTGQTDASLAGMGWLEAAHPDDKEHLRASWLAGIASGEPFDVTCRVRRSDGVYRTFHIGATPLREHATVIAWACYGTDISDRAPNEVKSFPQQETSDAETTIAELRALQAITDTALERLELDSLLHELLVRVHSALNVDSATILLLEPDQRTLVVRAALGVDEDLFSQVQQQVGQGFIGRIAATGEVIAVDDLSTIPNVNPILKERLRSALGAPLLVNNRLIGVAQVGSAHPRAFTSSERDLLRKVADRAARAIEQARLYQFTQTANAEAEARAHILGAIFDAITDGLIMYHPDGHIRQINTAAETLFGYHLIPNFSALSLAERAILVRVSHSDGRPIPVDMLPQSRALRGERLTGLDAVDLRIHTLYDTDIDVNASAAPLRDANGAIFGAVTVYRDVTERRRLEQTLGERARHLETILDLMPVGVAITDAGGRVLQLNDAFRRVWGDDAPLSDGIESYHEYKGWWLATGERVTPQEWTMSRALATGSAINGDEIEIETFNGERKTILNNAAPLYDAKGTVTGGVTVLVDITAQKQLEHHTHEALRALLAMAEAMVSQADDDADVAAGLREHHTAQRVVALAQRVLSARLIAAVKVNAASLAVSPVASVGFAPEEEQRWRYTTSQALLTDYLPANLLPRLYAGEQLELDLGEEPPIRGQDYFGVRRTLASAIHLGGNEFLMFAVESHDRESFTPQTRELALATAHLVAQALERDRLTREREEAQAHVFALEEANRRMDEFLGIAGHELRTPITTVKASLQLAERRADRLASALGLTEDPASEHINQLRLLLDRALSAVRRQERLVYDLLDVSRISAGKMEFRMEPLDLAPLAREVIEEQRLAAAGHTIVFVPAEEPLPLLGDSDRIRQALTNYMTNALKYSPEEAPVVVSLQREGSVVRVSVRDQGPGLTLDQQAQLFERFHRVEGIDVLTGSSVGLGLGLYICKTIIERHGGRVGVESEPGEGAIFWFTLPLLMDTTDADAASV